MMHSTKLCVLSLLAGLTACVHAPATPGNATALVERAVAAAGGREAIDRRPVLAWTGDAVVHAGANAIRIEVDTRVASDGVSTSRSWRTEQGPTHAIVMTVTPTGGTLLRGGTPSPMPETMWRHERIQYSLYQLLRLTPLLSHGTQLRFAAQLRPGLRGVVAMRPDLPEATLWFDGADRLREVQVWVPDAETQAPRRETMVLDGDMVVDGMHWPQRLTITLDDAPYFELRFKTFRASSQ